VTNITQADRRTRHAAIRSEVAREEAETAEAEVAEKAAVLEVPLHLRIDRALDAELRKRAVAAHMPTSALVRRLLREAIDGQRLGLSSADVEDIARRVAREELRSH
jgi:hypothetical protein